MTNGDKIRSMTDEELAVKVVNCCNEQSCLTCFFRYKGKETEAKICCVNSSDELALEWLRKEYPEEAQP